MNGNDWAVFIALLGMFVAENLISTLQQLSEYRPDRNDEWDYE